jgi:hypothetical protein
MAKRTELNPDLKHSSEMVKLSLPIKGSAYYRLWKLANMSGMSMADVVEALLNVVEGDDDRESELAAQLRKLKLAKTKARAKRRAAAQVALKLGDIALSKLDEAYERSMMELPPLEGGVLTDVKHARI